MSEGHILRANLPLNKPCVLAIRPEHVQLSVTKESNESATSGTATENMLSAIVSSISFSGATTTVRLEAGGLSLEALLLQPEGFEPGASVMVHLPPDRIIILK
jgi:hypothetical protein